MKFLLLSLAVVLLCQYVHAQGPQCTTCGQSYAPILNASLPCGSNSQEVVPCWGTPNGASGATCFYAFVGQCANNVNPLTSVSTYCQSGACCSSAMLNNITQVLGVTYPATHSTCLPSYPPAVHQCASFSYGNLATLLCSCGGFRRRDLPSMRSSPQANEQEFKLTGAEKRILETTADISVKQGPVCNWTCSTPGVGNCTNCNGCLTNTSIPCSELISSSQNCPSYPNAPWVNTTCGGNSTCGGPCAVCNEHTCNTNYTSTCSYKQYCSQCHNALVNISGVATLMCIAHFAGNGDGCYCATPSCNITIPRGCQAVGQNIITYQCVMGVNTACYAASTQDCINGNAMPPDQCYYNGTRVINCPGYFCACGA